MLSYQVYVLLVWKVCFASLDLMSEAMICVRVPESVLLTCGNQSVLNKMAWSSGAEGLVGCNASYLVLHNVTIEDSGMYTCKVGSLQPSVHFLNVHGSDELYASGSVGDCIHLPCGTGSRDIMQWGTSKWFKTEGSRELEIETNDTFIPTREFLVIKNLTQDHIGWYHCHHGNTRKRVFVALANHTVHMSCVHVGDTAFLPCRSDSSSSGRKRRRRRRNRSVDLSWFRERYDEDRVLLLLKQGPEKGRSLTLQNGNWSSVLWKYRSGVYACKQDRKHIFMNVTGNSSNIHLKPCQFQWDVPNPPSDCSRNQCHVKSCPAHKTSWQHFIDGRYWVIVATVACCFIVFGILLRLVHKWHRRKVLQEKLRTERTVRFHSLFGNDSTLNINQYMTSPATQANGNDLDNRAYINNEEEDSDNVSYENVELRCTGLKVNQATIQLFNSNLYSDSKRGDRHAKKTLEPKKLSEEEPSDGDSCYENIVAEKQEKKVQDNSSDDYLEPESPVENEEDRMSEETTDGDCYEEVDDEKQETLQKHPPLAKSVRPSASPQGGSSSDSDGDCYEEVDDEKQETLQKHPPLAKCIHPSASPQGDSSSDSDGNCYEEVDDEKQETLQKHPPFAKCVHPSASPQGGSSSDSDGDCYEEVDDEKQETSEKHPPLAKCVHPSASPQGGSSSDSDGDCYENMSELGKDTLQDENLDDGHSYEDMEGWSKKEPQESAPCSSSAQDGRSSDTDSDCYVNMDQKTELDDLSDEYEDMKDSVCGVLKKEDKELIDSEEDDNDGYVEMNESIYVAPRSATISTTGMSSNCQVGPSQGGSMRHESLKRHRSK
ncbi:uncharacterized protein LOC102364148 isoform X2 [Latimeria chalumnae]|uniref:uncharacterized protein LOC102364148 isoform X2 n=1 Tax=Latimeria chalumnae TaxID=7897 RepID=UPI00313D3EDC